MNPVHTDTSRGTTKQQESPCVEAVLHTSDDCIFVTKDHGTTLEASGINVVRNLSFCTEEEKETTECRKRTPAGDPVFVNIC